MIIGGDAATSTYQVENKINSPNISVQFTFEYIAFPLARREKDVLDRSPNS